MTPYIFLGLPKIKQLNFARGIKEEGLTTETIISAVEKTLFVNNEQMVSSSRKRPIVIARHIAMFLIRKYSVLPLYQVGLLFGGRDHSTVIYAEKQYEMLYGIDREFTNSADVVNKALFLNLK